MKFLTLALIFSANLAQASSFICGDYEVVEFEPQKVIFLNKEGDVLKGLPIRSTTATVDLKWNGSNYYPIITDISVPYTVDESGIYTTRRVAVNAKSRWKSLRRCRDKINDLTFHANYATRAEGADPRYYSGFFRTNLSELKGKKVVVPAPSVPHQVVLERREIFVASLNSRIPANEKMANFDADYQIQLEDGKKAFLIIRGDDKAERGNIDRAYEQGRLVRLYGNKRYRDDAEITIVYSDYADAIE